MCRMDKCGSGGGCCCDRRAGGCCCDRRGSRGCECGSRRCEGGFKRRYRTKAEQITELEQYLKDLKAEVQAVGEQLANLKRKK